MGPSCLLALKYILTFFIKVYGVSHPVERDGFMRKSWKRTMGSLGHGTDL